MRKRFGGMLAMAAMLSACGGNDDGTISTGGSSPATPAPTTTTTGCTVRERQDWAAAQLREWYLFPDTLPASLSPTPFATVDAYIDALTATARAQRKDRFFTYLTSIKAENAYYKSGASAGFGMRLGIDTSNRLYVIEAFEGASALAAGLDRGTEIVEIGTTTANLRRVDAIIAADGAAGLTTALGPDTVGTSRVLRIATATGTGTRTVTVTKTDFALEPVSSRYGVQVIADGGRNVGYLNLRTFISTADPALRRAFARFRALGVTNLIVDFRYNGGGSGAIAELMGDLLGANRSTSEVFSYTIFRTEKASNNETRFFAPQPQSIAPTKIAFIGTGGTASASELVINAFIPYLRTNAALIGTNTFGKPVGQIALDKAECDDRLRVVAVATQNAARQGAYYDGLAATVGASCRADDDITYPLGDPREASTRQALDFLAGRSCTPIAGAATASATASSARSFTVRRDLLVPDVPSTAQRMVPGAF